ncbi:ST3 beta-galactoside alpha-2,3-sialyltransferase 7 [Astyanax mexicanus]|uniref:Lactosylceramide alpha-2,3-sialyltransferase n=1 Tax=Astyanax mexicanus TaxID=7994 RepID=A0A3B1JUH0_ASTMX|nr:ST3 beta-galactoside alpha-2,3-sialyltransferase 7 [Astyanax mexicanus]
MVTLKHLSVKDHDEGSDPQLAEAGSAETAGTRHRRAESSEFFLNQQKNFALSLVLLLSCYSALLIPAYLPTQQATRNERTTQESMVLLNRSAALLSQKCRSGWSTAKLNAVPQFRSLLEIPVFLQNRTGHWELEPPLGLQGCEESLAHSLKALPDSGLPSSPKNCRRCMVVGSGGVLHGKQLGAHIDKHDIIIRMNNAPVFGFEKDAGSRTTIRLMYPEGAPFSKREYQKTDIIALVAFKSLDIKWLTSVVTRKPLSWWSKLWFWRNVVNEIPLQPENFRILNPEILKRTWHVLTCTKQQRKTVPTLGISAVVLALQLCDEVSLAGFGYDLQQPGALLHYYETLRMDAMMTQVVHDVRAESSLLKELVKAGVVNDLTGAL